MSDSNADPGDSDASTSGTEPDPEGPQSPDADRDRSRPSSRPESRAGETADEPEIATEQRRRITEVVTGFVAALGAWVAVSVFLYEIGETALWNNVTVGALIALGAGYNYYRQANDTPSSLAISGLVAVLGLWLVASTGVFELTGGAFLNTAASGLLVVALAGYNAYEAREARTATTDGA